MLSLEVLRRGQRCTVFALVVDGRAEAVDFLSDLRSDKMEGMIDRPAEGKG